MLMIMWTKFSIAVINFFFHSRQCLSWVMNILYSLCCVVWRRREPIGNFVLPSSGQWLVLPVSHTFPYMDICRLWRHKARRWRPGKMFPTTSPVEMAEPWVRVVVLKYSLKGDNSTDGSASQLGDGVSQSQPDTLSHSGTVELYKN